MIYMFLLGMTEIGGVASLQTNECKLVESAGFVAANSQLKVVDVDTGRSLGPNKSGECYIKTMTTMVGYYKNPAATESIIDEDGNFLAPL